MLRGMARSFYRMVASAVSGKPIQGTPATEADKFGSFLCDRLRAEFQTILDSVIDDRVRLGSYIDLAHSRVASDAAISNFCTMYKSSLGSFSYLAENVKLCVTTVGKFSSIGPNVVSGYGDHPTMWVSTSPAFYSPLGQCGISFVSGNALYDELKPVVIGSDCWIGANAVLKNGVTIGDGAIVGAGAFVNRDVAPYAIVVGTPAVLKRFRFSSAICDQLLRLQWWDLPATVLLESADRFRDAPRSDFINWLRNERRGASP